MSLTVPEQPVHGAIATVLPAVYLGVMLAQAITLRILPDGFWWLLLGFPWHGAVTRSPTSQAQHWGATRFGHA